MSKYQRDPYRWPPPLWWLRSYPPPLNVTIGFENCVSTLPLGYWLFQPYPALAEVLYLENGEYRIAGTYTETELLRSPSFPELTLQLSEIFPPPSEEETIQEVRETPYPAGAPTR